MMSGILIGFLAAVGAGAWLYARLMRTTGGNTKNALIGAGIAGFLVFMVVWSVAVMVDGMMG